MENLNKLESYLEPYFAKLPQLSKDTRRLLADITPWLVLIAGVIQVLSAWWLYQWAQKLDLYVNTINKITTTYGVPTSTSGVTFFAWLAIGILLLDGVIMLIAFPKLLKRHIIGWKLLFLSSIINLIYGVASTFIEGRGGLTNLFGALLGSAIGLYLLYQVRGYYGGEELKKASSATQKDITKKSEARSGTKPKEDK